MNIGKLKMFLQCMSFAMWCTDCTQKASSLLLSTSVQKLNAHSYGWAEYPSFGRLWIEVHTIQVFFVSFIICFVSEESDFLLDLHLFFFALLSLLLYFLIFFPVFPKINLFSSALRFEPHVMFFTDFLQFL